MKSDLLTESTVEEAAFEIFGTVGYTILHGPDIAPGEMFAERTAYSDVILVGRLREALKRINPKAPAEAIEEAIRKVLHSDSPNLVASNRRFHQFLWEMQSPRKDH
jgi:type I restriction enzyme R subunit